MTDNNSTHKNHVLIELFEIINRRHFDIQGDFGNFIMAALPKMKTHHRKKDVDVI